MNIRLQSKSSHHQNQPTLKKYYTILDQINTIRDKVKKHETLTNKDITVWNNTNRIVQNLNTATFRVHKSIFEFKWVELLYREFDKDYILKGFMKPIKKGVRPDRLKWSCGFDTSSSYQLFLIWLEWYTKNGKKVKKRIPTSFTKLTPNILLHWYIGDGTNSSGTLALYTFGFKLSDQKRLRKALLAIGVETELIRKRGKYYIRISKGEENVTSFFKFMSTAKYYNKANELLPHKFDRDLKKQEIVNKLRTEHPEYFDETADLSWDLY